MSVVLAIGGIDTSGGAGLTRDSAMAARLRCDLKPVVSALTVQTDRSVSMVMETAPDLFAAQLEAALAPPLPQAVKIGMLASPEQVQCILRLVPKSLPVVFDPVLTASSSGTLTPTEVLAPLLKRVTLLTPNLPEARILADLPEQTEPASLAAALLRLGPKAVLVKGGHGTGSDCLDVLLSEHECRTFSTPRLLGTWRGTGCRLSTAIACGLSKGAPIAEACALAKSALTDWLTEG